MAPYASEPFAPGATAGEAAGRVVAPAEATWPDTVSVILCTKDRPNDLARAIACIRAAGGAGRQAEIVVVEEADAPREVEGVRYVHLPRGGWGFGFARNAGLLAARGELVAFMDDDCEPDPGWLDALLAPLCTDPAILGVAGAVLVRNCGAVGYAENILGFPGGGLRYRHAAGGRVVPTRHLSTCNCAYRAEAVRRAGGFRVEARLGGEDFLLAERVAALGPCLYVPDAVVYHRPRGRLGSILGWFIRRGESEIALLGATANRGRFLRFLLWSSWSLRAAILFAILLVRPRLAALLPAAAVAYYGAMLWRFRFARAYPSHRRGWWVVPLVKATMDLGAELGRWRALVSRGSRR